MDENSLLFKKSKAEYIITSKDKSKILVGQYPDYRMEDIKNLNGKTKVVTRGSKNLSRI